MLTVLIADDEKPARDKLAYQLNQCDGFTLIAQATSGEDAIEKINSLKPDVVLLDVEMPNLNGLDVLDVIAVPCSVIFTTAYDQYAVKAFERAAVDYLLKPFSLARLKMALARVKIASEPLPDTTTVANKPLSSRVGDKTRLLALADLSLLTSQDGQTYALSGAKRHPVDYSLDELAASLPDNFVRVHRSCIANIHQILEIERWFNGNLLLKFKGNDEQISTSRSGTAKLKQLLDL